jgi:hypothetical protein
VQVTISARTIQYQRAILCVVFIALALSRCALRAEAEDVLEKIATLDPTVRFADGSSITIAPVLQTRWTGTETIGEYRDKVTGFSVPRARLVLTTRLFEHYRIRLRIGSSSNGSATFQQAYAQANWQNFQVRAGQLPLKLNIGEEPLAEGLSSVDYSSYSNTFAGGQTQGIEFAYHGPVRLRATLGNGARSGFSELLSPLVADVATTGRFEIPIGPQQKSDYDSQASLPSREALNARIGIVGHYQAKSARSANPANNVELVGADVALRGGGLSLQASGTYLQIRQDGLPTVQSAGVMLFASSFLARRVEVFGQFDAIWPLGQKVAFPPGFASGQPGTTRFRTLTVGSNFFIVPDVHRFKIQMDLQTMFDGQLTSIVPASPARGVLKSTDPQLAVRVQLVVAL